MTTLFDDNKPKRKPHPRDEHWHELFETAEAVFYRSGIADGQRANVAKLVDDLRQKGATAGNFAKRKARYHELFPRTVCTLPAMLNQWDTCAPVGRTTQPGMPTDAEQAQRIHEDACHRLECENSTASCNKARQAVLLADPNVVKRIHAEWRAEPENVNYLEFAKLPTSIVCVRDIAERIEAIGDLP